MKDFYPGLTILKKRTYSYEATIRALEKCDEEYGCEYCDRRKECEDEFEYQLTNRTGLTWKLRTSHAEKADAKSKGNGEADKSGLWCQGHCVLKVYNKSLLEIA